MQAFERRCEIFIFFTVFDMRSFVTFLPVKTYIKRLRHSRSPRFSAALCSFVYLQQLFLSPHTQLSNMYQRIRSQQSPLLFSYPQPHPLSLLPHPQSNSKSINKSFPPQNIAFTLLFEFFPTDPHGEDLDRFLTQSPLRTPGLYLLQVYLWYRARHP